MGNTYEKRYEVRVYLVLLVCLYFGSISIAWFYLGYLREFLLQYPDAHNLSDIIGYIMLCPTILKAAVFFALVLTITPFTWLIVIGVLRALVFFDKK